MVEEGPWAPIEDVEPDDETEEQADERGFWDYAAIAIAVLLVVSIGVLVASSMSGGERWVLAVHTEHGEYDDAAKVFDNGTVVFDAAIGFAGDPNGDVVEDVQVRAIGSEGQTIGTRCFGTLTNDNDNELQQFQFTHDQAPVRVIIEASAVHNSTATFGIQGWQRDSSFMGPSNTLELEPETYINASACQNESGV